MKCDSCIQEKEVRYAFYGSCLCAECWPKILPENCFDCGREKARCRCLPVKLKARIAARLGEVKRNLAIQLSIVGGKL